MNIFKSLQVSIDFSTKFFNNFASFRGSAPEPPTNAYFQNFLNFSLSFRVNFDKILKTFKNCKISFKIFNKL